jgi:hypothetical protein
MSELTGRELDAAVAEEVMGREIFSREWPCIYFKSDETWEVAPEDYQTREPRRWGGQPEIVWKFSAVNIYGQPYSSLHRVPDYSTDIAAAWDVVEKIEALEYGKVRIDGSHYHGWHCSVCWGPGNDGEGEAFGVPGATAPEAICRAALAAVRATTAPASPSAP